MRGPLVFLPVLLCAASVLAETVRPDACTVVIDPKAAPTTRFAAHELAGFLSRRFSRTVEIKTAPEDGVFGFVVGDNSWSRGAGLDPTRLRRDGFQVRTAPGRVFIAGVDDPVRDVAREICGGSCPRFQMASVFGVYDFLERYAGVRLFFPGELGEIVPKSETLELPSVDYSSEPDYLARSIYDGPRAVYFEDDGQALRKKGLNQVRMRMETEHIPLCHGLRTRHYLERFAKTHPEYFSFMGGRRNVDPNYRFPTQLCFSSDIVEEIYGDMLKAFRGGAKYFDAMPQDGMTPCECEKCRARYGFPADRQRLSDFLWGRTAEWGRRLLDDGVKGDITQMAYSYMTRLPEVALPSNLQVMVAVNGPFSMRNPDALKRGDELIAAWVGRLGHRVWLWTYPNKYGALDLPGIPSFAARAWGEFYAGRKDLIFGAFAESETDRWFYQHLNYYVYGKVSWDNDVDVPALIEDYYARMFVAPGVIAPMKAFADSLEEKWMGEIAGRAVDTPLGPKWIPPSDEQIWTKVYSQETLDGYEALLSRAAKAAAKLDDPLVLRRVKLYRRELYEPLVGAAGRYSARRREVAAQPVRRAGESIRLQPFDERVDGSVFSSTGGAARNLKDRDLGDTVRFRKTADDFIVDFDLVEPLMDQIAATRRERDDRNLWMDSCVEVYLCPSGDRGVVYHVIANSLGSHAECRTVVQGQDGSSDWKWDPELRVKSEPTVRGWRCEIAIPLASMEPMAERFPAEFCRERNLKTSGARHVLFHTSPAVDKWGNAADFAEIAPETETLVLEGPRTEVLLAGNACPVERFAAAELTNFLSAAFVCEVPIVTTRTRGRSAIVLGSASGLDVSGLARDAYVLRAEKDDGADSGCLFIAGRDDPSCALETFMRREGYAPKNERGTLMGVYGFLEKYAGVRFYFPGELGTVVPRRDHLEVPAGEERVAPEFTVRDVYMGGDGKWYEPPRPGDSPNFGKALSWCRLRLETFHIPCCHGQNGHAITERFAVTHPEYFQLRSDGTRCTNLIHGASRDDYRMRQLCHTSGVWDEFYEDIRSYFRGEKPERRGIPSQFGRGWSWNGVMNGRYADVMPGDGMVLCTCPRCKAAYGPNGDATELIWGNTAKLARRLADEGLDGIITQMAYPPYKNVPTVEIPSNVQVMVAMTGPWLVIHREQQRQQIAAIKAWTEKLGRKVWLWTYPHKYGPTRIKGLPSVAPRSWGEFYRGIAPFVFGAFAESETDKAIYHYLNYYVFARLGWDTSLDVKMLIDEHHRLMFGAAEAEMKAFYSMLERKWLAISGNLVDTPKGPVVKAPGEHEVWLDIYSEEVIAKLRSFLDSASAKVPAGSLEARRIAFFRREWFDPLEAASKKALGDLIPGRALARLRAQPPDNLLRNAGFDDLVFVKPRFWNVRGGGSCAWYTHEPDRVRLDTTTFVTPPASMCIRATNTASICKSLPADRFVPGHRYRVSYFVKTKDVVPLQSNGGVVGNVCADRNYWGGSICGTTDWVRQSFEFTAGPVAKCGSCLRLCLLHASGTVWFDEVVVEEVKDWQK